VFHIDKSRSHSAPQLFPPDPLYGERFGGGGDCGASCRGCVEPMMARLLYASEPPFHKQQVDVALEDVCFSVADVSEVCCRCFVWTKVDRDVTYIAMVLHVCCKRLFPMFYLFF
jgi:hypothetical protein